MKKTILVIMCIVSIILLGLNKQSSKFFVEKKQMLISNEQLIPNTIYIEDKYINEYVPVSEYTVDTNDLVKLKAVLETPLNMDGDVPSEQYYQGSGFWSWDTTITNVWTQLNSSKWLVECSIQTQGVGTFTVGLGKNGNGQIASISIHVEQNLIEIDEVKVGTQKYSHINKNLATRMFNGKNYGSNSASNRYVIYVGDSITLNASNTDNYTYEPTNNNTIRITKESSYENNNSSISFIGLNPGDNEILLKNQNGDVTEVFFIQTRYPIYVNTSNGEVHKDCVHEYLETALTGMYEANPDKTITNPSNVPQYVKNAWDYYMLYYLFGDTTVDLVTYVSAEDERDFEITDGLEMTNHKVETVSSGEKQGFKRISATFKIINNLGGNVNIGYDNFVMAMEANDRQIHHFDLETSDGGQAIKTETYYHLNGNKDIIEIYYHASIYDIHGSSIFSKTNKLLDIPKNEYWQTLPADNTQYESTSAYITNNEGHLIDEVGNIIDEDVINGIKTPQIKQRNINLYDVDKVSFVADINLLPYKKITKSYKINDSGVEKLINNKEESIINGDIIQYKNYELVMGHKEMLDAYNKCPYHSGLDFTIRLNLTKNETNGDIINPDTLNNLLAIILILVNTIMIITFIKKKRVQEQS